MSFMRGGTLLRLRTRRKHLNLSSLGSARFLKTVKCRHKNGYLVIKIFIKPDPGLSLRKYHKRLKGAYYTKRPGLRIILCPTSRKGRASRHTKRVHVSNIRGDRQGGLLDSAVGGE